MTKVLVDTNVILDALAAREPFRADAERIFLLAAREKIKAHLTASAVTDIHYIARRQLPDETVREALRNLFRFFVVVDVRRQECVAALDVPMADYEDALWVVCGRKAGVDYIITRDRDFLADAPETPTVISPVDFLKNHEGQSDTET